MNISKIKVLAFVACWLWGSWSFSYTRTVVGTDTWGARSINTPPTMCNPALCTQIYTYLVEQSDFVAYTSVNDQKVTDLTSVMQSLQAAVNALQANAANSSAMSLQVTQACNPDNIRALVNEMVNVALVGKNGIGN